MRRRQLLENFALGLLLIILVAGLYLGGFLERLEDIVYDQRCRRCQPRWQPTDQLAHVEVDDESIAAIGRWPWPRSVLGSLVTEIHRAGAEAIGLDMLLADRDEPADLGLDATAGVRPSAGESRDLALARAFADAGNVVLPVAFVFGGTKTTPQQVQLIDILSQNLETSREAAEAVLEARHLPRPTADEFLDALHEAMARGLMKAGFPQVRPGELRKQLLPGRGQMIVSTVASRVFDEELARAQALRAIGRFGRPADPKLSVLHCRDEITPLAEFSAAAGGSGFVDLIVASDGVTRQVPLWVEDHQQLYPQFGLALACAYLKIKPQSVQIDNDQVIVSGPQGQTAIPVRALRIGPQPAASLFMDVPFFGSADWLTSYDYPRHELAKQHVNITLAWEAVQTRQRLRHNNQQLDDALGLLISTDSPKKATQYMEHPPDLDDVATRQLKVDELLRTPRIRSMITVYEKETPDEQQLRDESAQKFAAAAAAATTIPQENARLAKQLQELRGQLHEAVGGKAVLIGSAATAAADFRTTPLHAQCPGFIVHGMVFNAIVTNHVWRRTARWVDVAAITVVGLLVMAAVVWLPPWSAVGITLVVLVTFITLNGYVLFGRFGWIAAGAGPLVSGISVWLGLTLLRLVRVSKERAQIVRRFRYYVDPALVDYVIEHPDRIRLDGEVRELTLAVVRLDDFGAVTEQLRERTIELLNQYMNVMVPLIRARGGYVNKFLGGGIMFFFGAPQAFEDHACRAVDAVLAMHAATDTFNERHTRRGMPLIKMRAGISTGPMVVGDAGADSGSDYTVLGAPVSLCFHFEEAAKTLGTRALVGESSLKHLKGQYLMRPIGAIDSPGMARAVMTYEPLCLTEAATEKDQRLVALTGEIVNCFQVGNLPECTRAVKSFEEEFGSTALSIAYSRLCRGQQVAVLANRV